VINIANVRLELSNLRTYSIMTIPRTLKLNTSLGVEGGVEDEYLGV